MEEKKETQPRRKYAAKGERNSKMISFRADADVVRILEHVRNKGRLLNDLVRCWRDGRRYAGDEVSPREDDLDEYFT